METRQGDLLKATRKRSPKKVWCGIPRDVLRKKKEELSKEEYERWFMRVTGRDSIPGSSPKKGGAQQDKVVVNWESVAKKMENALFEQVEENRNLKKEIAHLERDNSMLRTHVDMSVNNLKRTEEQASRVQSEAFSIANENGILRRDLRTVSEELVQLKQGKKGQSWFSRLFSLKV